MNREQAEADRVRLLDLLKRLAKARKDLIEILENTSRQLAKVDVDIAETAGKLDEANAFLANQFPILESGPWVRRLVGFDGKLFYTRYDKSAAVIKYTFPEGIRTDQENAARLDVKAALELWKNYIEADSFDS